VTAWLRFHGVHQKLGCSIDGGVEWHANQERCFKKTVRVFYEPLGCHIEVIRKGHPEDNPYVERSHRISAAPRRSRTDDEEFYVPLGLRWETERDFLPDAWWWTIFMNEKRSHQGINDRTPLEALRERLPSLQPSIARFPPIILDRHLPHQLGGQNVLDYYPVIGQDI